MEKPTVDQVAWVFQQINNHIRDGGSFRVLIYDRLEYTGPGDYSTLYLAGGMNISNACNCYHDDAKTEES